MIFPFQVLAEAQKELLNYGNLGISVMGVLSVFFTAMLFQLMYVVYGQEPNHVIIIIPSKGIIVLYFTGTRL